MQMMTTRHHSRRRSAPRAGRWGTRLGRCLSLTATALVTAALLPVAAAKPAAAAPAGGSGGDPGSAELLQTLPGFKIERILKADPTKNGSWISMARDSKGRLLLGGQARQPVTRVTIKDGKVEKEEILDLQGVTETMGILEAHGALYVNGQRSERHGNQTSTQFGLWT